MEKTEQAKPHPLVQIAKDQKALALPVAQAIKQATRARPGQPTVRTEPMVEEILDRIACGEALVNICQDDHLCGYSTCNGWCRKDRRLQESVDIAYEYHARTMDDMADSILAGGIGSTGDFRRDEARVGHLRYRLGKLNARFRDKVQLDVVQTQVFVMPGDVIDGEGY